MTEEEAVEETEEISILCTWQSVLRVEVPLGYRPERYLMPEDDIWLEHATSATAELTDWEVI